MPICRVIRFILQDEIDSNRCLLIRYEHGCISHMLSLVITLKLKDPDDENERMNMDDGYLR